MELFSSQFPKNMAGGLLHNPVFEVLSNIHNTVFEE
jgi:hypothetical protein